MNLDDIRFEFTRGTGPGGQHKNKTSSAVRATHIPTNIVVFVQDERSQHANKRKAIKILEERVNNRIAEKKAHAKKARRDEKIHERNIVRTYNYSRGTVKDHRSGKVASIKDVVDKGRIDLLKP